MTRSAAGMTAGQARELLGLATDADAAALGRAYRTAVKAAHPDLGGGDAERLRLVIDAHRLLKSLRETRILFSPAPAVAPVKAALSAKITLEEAIKGARRRLTQPGGGSLQVRLPKGLRAGDVLRLKRRDGGDVLVRIAVLPEPGVTVRGDDLWLEVSAPAGQVKPGARLEVDTPRGRRALVAPDGMADGKPIRLKGQGLPARGRHPAGDLILKLRLEPTAAEVRETVSQTLLRRFSARWAA